MKKSLLYLFFISIFSCFISISVYADANELNNLTQTLLNISSQKNLSSEQLIQIRNIAQKRQDVLKNNLVNADKIAKNLLPNKIRQQLPLEVQPFIEKEVFNIRGTLIVRAADQINGDESYQYVVRSNDENYYLHFTNIPPSTLETDSKILIKDAILVSGDNGQSQIILAPEELQVIQKPLALPLSFGPQKTIAILINFADKQTQPFTTASVSNTLFTTVNDYYKEASYNQTSIVGQVIGWYTSTAKSTDDCDTITSVTSKEAQAAAIKAGINLSQYPRRIYIFPHTSSCEWGGLGYVGGSVTDTWSNGYNDLRVLGHELGHNVGLHHARFLICSDGPNTGTCTRSTYGDGSDLMGGSSGAHFNAYQKDRLGWLNYNVSPPITTVTKSGSYLIDPYETKTTKPKALKILKRAGTAEYYFIEFRQGIGFDKRLETCGTSCNYTKGVVLHQGNMNDARSSELLDMTPTGGVEGKVALLPCQKWSDPSAPNGGVTFSLESIGTQGAKVRVTYGGLTPKCAHKDPTISLSHNNNWIKTGETTDLILSITNNDNDACKFENYTLTLPTLASINGTLNKSEVKVAPGKTENVVLSLQTSNSTPVGIYTHKVEIQGTNHKVLPVEANVGVYK